jgi:arabinofuranosyltransferase
MTRDRAITMGLLLAIVAIYVVNAWITLPGVVDDAWISARYARNLALGNGLTYNVGQPPVEGYTNLAFVVLLAGLWKIGADMYAAMVGVGLVSGAAGLLSVTALTRALARTESPWAVAPAALLAFDAHYAVVATNGIESSMFVACVVGACAAAITAEGRARWAAGLLCGFLAAIRPEGVAVAFALAGFDLLRRRDRWNQPETWAIAAPVLAWATLVWGFRLVYFQALVPNTFSAKAHKSVSDQLAFNIAYLGPDAPFWIGVAVILVASLVVPPRDPPRLAVGAIIAGLVAVAFSVDMWMPGGRLLMPATCLALALAGSRLVAVADRDWRVAAVLLAIALPGVAYGPIPDHVRAYDKRNVALPGNPASLAAEFLGEHLPPGSHLATRDAGVLAYFAGPNVVIDELHPRALTRPHPGGADAKFEEYTPRNPEVFIATVQRIDAKASKYAGDADTFRKMTADYRYLGRVEQHFHRYYDVYVRADVDLPELPAALVVNFDAPAKPPHARAPTDDSPAPGR